MKLGTTQGTLTGVVNVPRRSSPFGFSSFWRLTAGFSASSINLLNSARGLKTNKHRPLYSSAAFLCKATYYSLGRVSTYPHWSGAVMTLVFASRVPEMGFLGLSLNRGSNFKYSDCFLRADSLNWGDRGINWQICCFRVEHTHHTHRNNPLERGWAYSSVARALFSGEKLRKGTRCPHT